MTIFLVSICFRYYVENYCVAVIFPFQTFNLWNTRFSLPQFQLNMICNLLKKKVQIHFTYATLHLPSFLFVSFHHCHCFRMNFQLSTQVNFLFSIDWTSDGKGLLSSPTGHPNRLHVWLNCWRGRLVFLYIVHCLSLRYWKKCFRRAGEILYCFTLGAVGWTMRFQITKTHRINIYKQYVSVIAVVCRGLLHEGMYSRAEYSVIAFFRW